MRCFEQHFDKQTTKRKFYQKTNALYSCNKQVGKINLICQNFVAKLKRYSEEFTQLRLQFLYEETISAIMQVLLKNASKSRQNSDKSIYFTNLFITAIQCVSP